MAQCHTIDDLPASKSKQADAAIDKFLNGKMDDQDLYDKLTNLGLSPEGADEYINLLVEGA